MQLGMLTLALIVTIRLLM